ncbi:YwpF-like family protein [Caldibacillus thermolactis]|uniref:YwpF-like family protein n=1 Tax=Pallidibacillus thermolactis TaxID=251051 RepID=A0ABT2WFF8_9BACI|nr:YwpF-like family protein [Pallidibacillus thermolactis]MCU9594162.1 YwpF-like family protein [Pallidibacillus thermolactis]MCU9599748.1 YwpF-like family protein [Pallidibacillus thermolactis subsp. kokeshiiformis]MED1673264.1 YwpF-like family protein [Pallidibacillus thermolactis subsp. kokeshiiformis]
MKTFKLVSFYLVDKKGDVVSIPLIDALIINKENEINTWIIEVFVDKKYLDLFQEYSSEEKISVYTVITKKDNEPAPFLVQIISQKVIGENASILFEGKLNRTTGYAEQLLEALLETGLGGNELLTSFKQKMKDKTEIIRKKKL